MKTQQLSYSYDPQAQALTIFIDGKAAGGFRGPLAEKKYMELLGVVPITITTMNSDQFKKTLIRQFHAAMAKQGIMQHKTDILAGYGVESTSDLTIDQLKELVDRYSTGDRAKRAEAPATLRGLRSDLLTILDRMGIRPTGGDWTAVNDFCLKHTGKMIYQMDEIELRKARRQFHSISDFMQTKIQSQVNNSKLN